ncbi:MAG: DNA adenine methylase, partial [Deltaproteobacteria bacterium]|nr:DNA adenine methylase [Deltaproteobacteria bacterium]
MKRNLSPIYLDEVEGENSPVVYLRPRRRKRIVFGWYGGKFNHLDWLLPLLPKSHHYCEPFSGSAAVLLNRVPSQVETYNDIDGDVVNFFRVLRDRPDEIVRAIALTPFSREELYAAVHGNMQGISDIERARRFYVRARQVRTGLAQTATLGRWANCKNTSRAGMSGVVSRWLGGVEALDDIAMRLLRVQIENRPAIDMIKL